VSGKVEQKGDFDYILDSFVEHFDFYVGLTSPEVPFNININNARSEKRGHKFTSMGERKYDENYQITEEEKGVRFLYILDGFPHPPAEDEMTDVYNFKRGFTTITPLSHDLTHYKQLAHWASLYQGKE
jgi:broad specificity polyphosphatase/5'/3'-nucleotidase SurE